MNFFKPKIVKTPLLLYEQNCKISVRSKLNPSSHIMNINNSEKGRNSIVKATNTNELNQQFKDHNENDLKSKPKWNNFIENKENKSIQNQALGRSKENNALNASKSNIKADGKCIKKKIQLKKNEIKTILSEKITQNQSRIKQANANSNPLNKSYSYRIPFDLNSKMPNKNSTFNNKSQNSFLLDNKGNNIQNCKDFKSFINDSVRKNSQKELKTSLSNKKFFDTYINNNLKKFSIKKLNIQNIMKNNSKSKILKIKGIQNCGYEFDEKSFCEGWEASNKPIFGIEKANTSLFANDNISFDKELITTKESKILNTFESSMEIDSIFKTKECNKKLNTSKLINESLNLNDLSIISSTGLSFIKKKLINPLPINSNNTRNFSTRTEIVNNGKKCNESFRSTALIESKSNFSKNNNYNNSSSIQNANMRLTPNKNAFHEIPAFLPKKINVNLNSITDNFHFNFNQKNIEEKENQIVSTRAMKLYLEKLEKNHKKYEKMFKTLKTERIEVLRHKFEEFFTINPNADNPNQIFEIINNVMKEYDKTIKCLKRQKDVESLEIKKSSTLF